MSRRLEKHEAWRLAVTFVRTYDELMELLGAAEDDCALLPQGLEAREVGVFTPQQRSLMHAHGYLERIGALIRPTGAAYEADLIDRELEGIHEVFGAIGQPYRKRLELFADPAAGAAGLIHVTADLSELVEHHLLRRDGDGYRITGPGLVAFGKALEFYVEG